MGTLFGVAAIGAIVVGSGVIEHRLNVAGYTNDAKTVRTFTRYFVIGVGIVAVYFWIGGVLLLFR